MCLAILIKPYAHIDYERLLEAHTANPDGAGFMFADGKMVRIVKGTMPFDTLFGYFKLASRVFPGSPIVWHFRAASSSKTSADLAHPFKVSDKLAFVHNGNLYEYQSYFADGYRDDLSDTIRFNEQVLKRLPAGFLNNPEIRLALGSYCRDNYSKMVFLESTGETHIVNEQAGYWKDNVWYSNGGIANYVGYGFSGAYYYHPGDVRHKGGLISPWMFSENIRAQYRECPVCYGYFRQEQLTQGKCRGCRTWGKLLKFVR